MRASTALACVLTYTLVQGVFGNVCLPGEHAHAECNDQICCCSTLPDFLNYTPKGDKCEAEMKTYLLVFLIFIPVIVITSVFTCCKLLGCLCFHVSDELDYGDATHKTMQGEHPNTRFSLDSLDDSFGGGGGDSPASSFRDTTPPLGRTNFRMFKGAPSSFDYL